MTGVRLIQRTILALALTAILALPIGMVATRHLAPTGAAAQIGVYFDECEGNTCG